MLASAQVELVATPELVDHVRNRGGALYVWAVRAPCCGGMIELRASTEQPAKEFRKIVTASSAPQIDLYLTAGLATPESLHLELGRRGRVRAFWNGLAWMV